MSKISDLYVLDLHVFLWVLFVTGYQVAEGFSSIQDGVDKCFSQEAKVICEE